MRYISVMLTVLLSATLTFAQDAKPLPPIKPIPRLLPPKGIDIGQEERDKLEARLSELRNVLRRAELDADLRPDVEIYTKAVRWALDFDEFYDAKKDIAKAHAALDSAQKRLDELRGGKHPWTTQRGLLARGYTSDIDGSVQPYGLHIPANLDLSKPVPLLVWLHGRGDKETDLHFIATREKNKGEFAPDWCITLHPYGRGTIGFKFAGEIDVLDAIESVKKRYKIDEDRIALAGFSMGGAGAWHIGAHYADRFCVVHAGAGFVETAKYNRLKPEDYPAPYVQKLWGWYDVPCYTRNLFNVPVIAYSGELDKQKQAADLMAEAFKAEGRELNHIIGPGVEHKYEAKAKEEILKQIKAAVDKGREKWPKKVSLQTRTERYGRAYWLTINQIEKRWEDARVDAEWVGADKIVVDAKNITQLFIQSPNDGRDRKGKTIIVVNEGPNPEVSNDLLLSRGVALGKNKGRWHASHPANEVEGYRGEYCPGPIDDAFMKPFLVVEPSGQSAHPRVQRWVESELAHFKERWRAVMRGDIRVKKDMEMTDADRSEFNLVLWGEPESNLEIFRVMQSGETFYWDVASISLGKSKWTAADHVAILAFQPQVLLTFRDGDMIGTGTMRRYAVLNSGPTFREGHDRTNSQQTPKLPDWAIIGLDKDPDAFAPGEIKAAGFFDENWKVKKEEGR